VYSPDTRRGLKHGHPTTPIEKAARPSQRKGILSAKTKLVRSIVREVTGFSAYERRVMELLRNSKVRERAFTSSDHSNLSSRLQLQDKKARKLTKKRVCIFMCVSIKDVPLMHRRFVAWHFTSLEAQARGA
jgi:large subunit ribosomal protein L36e